MLDHLVDTAEAGPQSVSAILAALPPGTSRNTAESAIKRNFDAGLIERVAPGTYVLAKPKPPAPPKPQPPEPFRSDGTTDQQWFSWIEEWKASGVRKGLGNPPDQSGHLVPMDVIFKYGERVRKREQRRKDAEAAAAKQAAADAELIGLKRTVDRRIDPRAAPIVSWRDERFLRAVARSALLDGLLPNLVATWKAAGTTPQQSVKRAEPSPAVRVPVQQENAPVPHRPQTTPQPAMTQPRPAQANLLNTRSPRGTLPDSRRPSALGLGLPSGVVGPPAPAPDDDVPPF